MKTFGELLTEYMTRTGIGDSELARHLGVSRQTIFRWKEGMTARPRVREDVLKCADRLRLTAAERDTLLLAAGFAPETRPPTEAERQALALESPSLPLLETTALTQFLPTELTVATAPPIPARVRGRRGRVVVGFLVFLMVLGALGAAGFLMFPQERDSLIAWVVPPPTVIPAPPDQLIAIAKFNSRGGSAPPYDVTARLRQALEAEIEAQQLTGVRLADLADTVRDDERAEQLRTRSGAKLVLWGNFSGDNTRVEIGSEPRQPLVQTGASVVPILPRDQSVTLDIRLPNETRALALVALVPLHLDRTGGSRSLAVLQEAQKLTPFSSEMRAAMDFYAGYLLQTTEPRDLEGAIRAYSSNLRTTSLYEAFLNRGLAHLALNQDAEAKVDFQRAQQIGDRRSEAWRATCWAYVLEQQPQAALPFCEASATRDVTGWSLDTRGIVYAQLGRYADAASELENFLRWLGTQPADVRALYTPSRQAWIATLRAGRNPFDVATLQGLRGPMPDAAPPP